MKPDLIPLLHELLNWFYSNYWRK